MPTTELATGLLTGAVAALALLAARATGRWGSSDPVPLGGAAVAAAALVAIASARAVPVAVVAGVVGVGAVACLPVARRRALVGGVLAVPFSLLLALDASATLWVRAAVVVTAGLGAALVARADEALPPPGIGLPLLAASAAGVFAAVPDTEEAAALLGAVAAVTALGWPWGLARLGPAGGGAATALLAWVVAVGGRGRPPAIVGGLACLGLLVAAPAVAQLARRVCTSGRPAPAAAVLGVQVTTVLVASRGAGIRSEMGAAVALSLLSAAIALVGALGLEGGRPSRRRSRR
ncbi:MAG: hypothetical protein ACLGI8_05425 [Acidimicrobiia bacterium]